MEKKLDARKKGFAFNFSPTSEADTLPQENAGSHEAFRFSFKPEHLPAGGDSFSAHSGHTPAVERLSADLREFSRRSPTSRRTRTKKKKKKKKTKQVDKKCQDEEVVAPAGNHDHPVICNTHDTGRSGAGDSHEVRDEVSQLPQHRARRSDDTNVSCTSAAGTTVPPHRPISATQDAHNDARVDRPSGRPPPGLTLDSWKDPALSDEERWRRRFGRGVRNITAIQRSRDARKTSNSPSGSKASAKCCDENSDTGRCRAAAPAADVFAFGFDIGIQFGGS